MNVNTSSGFFPVVRPLMLFAFDRTWKLNSWFEPVWWSDGRLAALEMLTRPVDFYYNINVQPECFFQIVSSGRAHHFTLAAQYTD